MLNITNSFREFYDKLLTDGDPVTHSAVTVMGTRSFSGCSVAIEKALLDEVFEGFNEKIGFELSYHDPELSQYKKRGEPSKEPFKRPPARLTIFVGGDHQHYLHYNLVSDTKENGKVLYHLRSSIDPGNFFGFVLDENDFPAVLVKLVKQDLKYMQMSEDERKNDKLLAHLPKTRNNWLPSIHLPVVIDAILKKINSSGYHHMDMNRMFDFKMDTKYIGIRIDQRNGGFTVTADKSPELHLTHNYPDHMYPQGWDSSCEVNPSLVEMVTALDKVPNLTETDPKTHVQARAIVIERFIKEMVGTRRLTINDVTQITADQLLMAYGQKD